MAQPTIRDVARRANVSIASVSRVFNGLDVVSPDTRERVLSAAAELGYVPHAGARSLSLARSQAIGAILPDLHGEFFSEFVRGMEREASARDHLLLLSNMHVGDPRTAPALKALRGRVDGLVIMAPHVDAAALAAALPSSMPIVLVNTQGADGQRPVIGLDNVAGAEAVVDHLVETGRRRLVHIAGPQGNVDAAGRAEGFRRAVARHGVEGEILQGNFDEASGEAAGHQLLASQVAWDAVFAANDMMAIGCLHALRTSGVDVPGRIAVAGFDDVPLARYLSLTTMRVHIAEIGARAVARLLGAIESRPDGRGHELHAPELVVRATTVGGAGAHTATAQK